MSEGSSLVAFYAALTRLSQRIPPSAPPLCGQGVSGAAGTFFDFTAFRSECVSAPQSKER